jgi:hypothetical protein
MMQHEWTRFYVCARCGVSQYEAGITDKKECVPVEDEDPPILVDAYYERGDDDRPPGSQRP